MPQAYAELRFKGEIGPGFLAFCRQYLELRRFLDHHADLEPPLVRRLHARLHADRRGLPAAAAAAGGWLGRALLRLAGGRPAWRLLLVPAIPFVIYRLMLDPLFPTTHTLWGDWANIAHTLTIFLIGFMVAKSEDFWRAVDRALPAAVGLTIALGVVVLAARLNVETVRANDELRMAVGVVRVLYAWSMIVTLARTGAAVREPHRARR